MKVVFITIVLDGMPWIASHFWEWRKLSCSWEWRIAEGVAAPVGCTSWVEPMAPRLSQDGTTEFIDSLAAFDPRVILFRKALWPGKLSMLNAALKSIDGECLLIEVDHDEIWTAEQITKLRDMFIEHPHLNVGYFYCRYFVGPDIVITSRFGFGNHTAYEWIRAWRYQPGMKFDRHEPPNMAGLDNSKRFSHGETEEEGLVFDHMAYATEAQVKFKCAYYGNSNNANGHKYSLEGWRKLQANTKWPVTNLQEFLPWVGPGVTADKI